MVAILGRVRAASTLVRLKSFDTSTADGRSLERHRRILLSAVASLAARAVGVLTSLVSVPLTVGYLGMERYGLWMTISSVIAMLSFADLGMGNGLMNAISESHGTDDKVLAHRYVSSAFFLLSAVSVVLGTCFLVAFPLVPWQSVFNVSSTRAISEAGPAMAAFVGCFLVALPLSVVSRVQMGYQEGFVNSLWTGAGNLLSLAGVLVAIYLRAGLPWLVLAMAGVPSLSTLANSVVLFGFQRPWLRPRWDGVAGNAVRRVLQLGILFLVLQIAMALAYTSDNIVVAHVLGPEAVAEYAIPMKLFGFISMILGMITYPLWPAYGESMTRGDYDWVRRTLVRSLIAVALVTSCGSAFLVVFGSQLVRLWVGSQLAPSILLLAGLGVWTVLGSVGNTVAMFLNGSSVVAFQVLIAVPHGIGGILLKVLLASVIGVAGIPWAIVLAYCLFVLMPYAIYVPKLLRSKKALAVA